MKFTSPLHSAVLTIVLLAALGTLGTWFASEMQSAARGEVAPPIMVQCPKSRDTAHAEMSDLTWYCPRCRTMHNVSETRVDSSENELGDPSIESHPPVIP